MKTKEEQLHSALVNDTPITGGQTIKDTRALAIRDDKTEAVIAMTDAIIVNGVLNVYVDLHAYKGSRTGAERFLDKCRKVGINPTKPAII